MVFAPTTESGEQLFLTSINRYSIFKYQDDRMVGISMGGPFIMAPSPVKQWDAAIEQLSGPSGFPAIYTLAGSATLSNGQTCTFSAAWEDDPSIDHILGH
jgi:hypothetical protein